MYIERKCRHTVKKARKMMGDREEGGMRQCNGRKREEKYSHARRRTREEYGSILSSFEATKMPSLLYAHVCTCVNTHAYIYKSVQHGKERKRAPSVPAAFHNTVSSYNPAVSTKIKFINNRNVRNFMDEKKNLDLMLQYFPKPEIESRRFKLH